MSTAVAVAPDVVRASNKAGMAAALSRQPESIAQDIKAAIAWAPKKIASALRRALRVLHVPQFLSWARRHASSALAVVGKGAFVTEVLTSHWGQGLIRGTVKTAAKVARWSAKMLWRTLTLPVRPFGWGKRMITTVENRARALTTYNKNNTTHNTAAAVVGVAGAVVSADRAYMKVTKIGAQTLMAVRITRKFVPAGIFRWAAYALDAIITYFTVRREFGGFAKRVWKRATLTEAEVQAKANTVIAEADHLVRENTEKMAADLRMDAQDIITGAKEEAARMEQEADALQAQAEQMAAAEAAANAVAAEQAAASTAVAVIEKEPPAPAPSPVVPTPGPVPSTGGPRPTPGPSQQSGKPHGGKPPKKH